MLHKKKQNNHRRAPQLITDSAPFEYVESYKALRTNFNFVSANGKNKKVLVTSTLRDEGKSSVSVNLALSLAQAGSKVLLIDADLRNPTVHRYLSLKKTNNYGLSTLLSGDVTVGECLIKTQYGVDVIGGGAVPPNPTELIASDAMHDLLDTAAQLYDYIICDAPPVGVITDAAALSPLCDGVLYIVRYKFASRNQVRSAVKNLRAVDAKLLGTIMTQYDISQNTKKRYGYYRYSYRYGYGYGYGYGKDHSDCAE